MKTLTVPDRIDIRLLAARDSMEALTELINRAYNRQTAGGGYYSRDAQSVETTRQRAAEGQCFIAEQRGRIVGTITVSGPFDPISAPWAAGMRGAHNRDTAHFHQFAVDPDLQGHGLGRRLLATCERWARERGYKRMALDTAEQAAALRALYRKQGYEEVSQFQRDDRPYRSVVMEKALDQSALRDHLRMLARYNLWATTELLQHVDQLPEADYRRDVGLFFKSVHGTLNHLLLGEHEVWYRRFAEGASPITALDVEVEADRTRLRQRLIDGALAWLPLLEVWPESRLLGSIEYKRVNGQAAVLPFAGTLGHVFNHGTHHRGQITAALTAMGRPCPQIDLVLMLAQEAQAQ